MSQPSSPIRFDPSFEIVEADEYEVQRGLTEAMLSIARKTAADTGHAYRAVHAKAHGYARARLSVLPDLPEPLAQGLFALPGDYDCLLRFSTTPGDILHDNISMPRGLGLKILDVPGERLAGSEGERSQTYVLGNSPSFQVADARAFLRQLRLLAATTGRAEPAKHVVSLLSRAAEATLEAVGQRSATLVTIAGQARTHPLGDSFFSQGAILHGDYFGKVAVSPISPELVALSESPIDVSDRDALRAAIRDVFRSTRCVWELRVQLATDIGAMPVEDAAADWPQTESAYRPVARIVAEPQDSWSDDLRDRIEDDMALSPWAALAAHRPLGSIMRARRPAYAAASRFRMTANGDGAGEPPPVA